MCNEKVCDVPHNVTWVTAERASQRYGLGSHGWESTAPADVFASDNRDARPNDPPRSPCCPARQGHDPVATHAAYAASSLLMFSQGLLVVCPGIYYHFRENTIREMSRNCNRKLSTFLLTNWKCDSKIVTILLHSTPGVSPGPRPAHPIAKKR